MAHGLQVRSETEPAFGSVPTGTPVSRAVALGLLVLLALSGIVDGVLRLGSAIAGDPRPGWSVLGEVVVVLVAAAAAARPVTPAATWGWVFLLAAVVCPELVPRTDLSGRVEVALLSTAGLSVAGLSLVSGIAVRSAGLLSTGGFLVLLLGVNPLRDLACWETCQDAPAPLAPMLSTAAAVRLGSWMLLLGLAMIVVQTLTAATRDRPTGVGTKGMVLVSSGLLLAAWLPRALGPAAGFAPLMAGGLIGATLIVAAVPGLSQAAARLRVRRAARALAAGLRHPDVARALAAGLRHPDVARLWQPGPQLLSAMSPTQRLALRNVQLTEQVQRGIAEVRASRDRILAAADAERRRTERNLHDSTQQRLVSIALHLQVAMARSEPGTITELRSAEAEITQALSRLQQLSRGLSWDTLENEGLHAALDELAAETPAPIHLDLDRDVLTPGGVGPVALYEVAAATLHWFGAAPRSGQLSMTLRRVGDSLVLSLCVPGEAEVTAPGLQAAMQLARDRLVAADGSLEISPDGTGVRIEAVLPCGS